MRCVPYLTIAEERWRIEALRGLRAVGSHTDRDLDELLILESRAFHRSAGGFTYFVEAEEVNRIKIGQASNVMRRMFDLQAASPCKLTLLGALQGRMAEHALHVELAEFRVIREWFDAVEAVRSLIGRLLVADGVEVDGP